MSDTTDLTDLASTGNTISICNVIHYKAPNGQEYIIYDAFQKDDEGREYYHVVETYLRHFKLPYHKLLKVIKQ